MMTAVPSTVVSPAYHFTVDRFDCLSRSDGN